jgi:succinate dehydrogenase/fumarate reductase flavoprotein subunit
MLQNYDLEADVIVIGYGAGGSSAAISAHDAGASVILLEKMPHCGGNTGVAGGNMTIPKDPEPFKKHLKTLVMDTVEPELIDVFVDELMKNSDWFKEMGAELRKYAVPPASCSTFIPDVTFPGVPGAEDVLVYCIKESDVATSPCGGQRLIQVMSDQVNKRDIKVMLSTPVKELIQNQNKEIVGVIAESDGKQITIKSKKGVILTCGGFENNPELKRDFLSPKIMHFSGNAGNTGDGLKMVQKVGGSLWHLGIHLARCGMQVPGFDATFSPDFVDPGFIWVDKHGHRFTNEGYMDVHLFGELLAKFNNDKFEYSNIPFYAIFDEQVRRMGPVCWGVSGPNIIVHKYKWSTDNQEEIKKGWIIKADSLSELAEKLSVDTEVLDETLKIYNENCKKGNDPIFNRAKDVLRPLEGPPYYALELWPSVINTQGGPKRDTKSRVLDPDNNPIPRLYAAGEFGSIWGFKYQTSTNISEALIYGRIAGKHAASTEPVGE